MGLRINIDEALKMRTHYNILKEPLHKLLQDRQEAWEKSNPIDLLYNRSSMDTFQETYTSNIGFDHAFTETADDSVGPIFNQAEGFSATYRTRTFQGSFVITRQALEDRQDGKISSDAQAFQKRWHGDVVEYAMAAIQGGFENVDGYDWVGGDGKNTNLRLTSADTKTGDIDSSKPGNNANPLFYHQHTIVKRPGMSDAQVAEKYQSNIYAANINLSGSDAGKIAKLADVINQVITAQENYYDDNGKIAGVSGTKQIVCANDPVLKASLETALSMEMFHKGESDFINLAYKRATVETTPYLNNIPCCKRQADGGIGFFIVDKAYNASNHGPEFTERVAFELEVTEQPRTKSIFYDGRQRFDINCASWRGITYVYIGDKTQIAWKQANGTAIPTPVFTDLTPAETVAKPVTVVGQVHTKEDI